MKQAAKVILIVAVVVLVLLGLWRLPQMQADGLRAAEETPTKVALFENECRKTLVQFFGGAGLLLGLYFTARRVTAMERRTEATEQGQITERFSRAIDQLASESLEVRVGGHLRPGTDSQRLQG
ncbi:MAG: hypothetical protein JSU63_11500 [Phycisphaerales bacterium]|nr:MAG: hypothetical protein JSU63_11500 [Phycisphaerales bacterium]